MRFIIDRYIFCEWFKILLLSLLVTVGLLIVHDVYDNLPDLLATGATIGQVLFYYLGLIPSFLPAIVPLALMISLLFALGGLHRNGEIIALRAAGLSLFQITRVLWVAGLCIAGFLFYLNAVWVPWSVENTRNFAHRLQLASEIEKHGEDQAGLIAPFSYANSAAGHLWVMHEFSEITNQGFGISFYARTPEGKPSRQIVAPEGFFEEVAGHWVFLKGRETTFDIKGEPLRSVYFERLETPEYTDDPVHMLLISQSPQDLSLWELKRVLDASALESVAVIRPYAVRYQGILASPLMALIVLCLAIPLAVAGVRVNPVVGVSKCVGLFFLYFFLDSLCTLMGDQGQIPILVAVWLPGVLMLILAVVLYKKAA